VLILVGLLVLFAVAVLAKTVRIVPQARAGIVERFGKYKGTLPAGLNVVVPFVDKVRYMIDLREQVVSFPPQPVITEDNLVVSIDTVIYRGDLRDRQLHPGRRAADHDHAAQHRRWHGPRGDPHQP
jgi:regulator of protease activity HflC (stomatin/prohibitin superfamily)